MSNHSVTCKICLKNAVISVWGCVGVGVGACMCVGVCMGGVIGCVWGCGWVCACVPLNKYDKIVKTFDINTVYR